VETDRAEVGENVGPVVLNVGCGRQKLFGAINVDAFESCEPDVVWDLNKTPWPFPDDYADYILASHILEHLIDYWPAVLEFARILKVGGSVEIRVPDIACASAITCRDHYHVLNYWSFHGLYTANGPARSWTNAWALEQEGTIPLQWQLYHKMPYPQYEWMTRWCPWLLKFCANHLRGFIHEQVMVFQKIVLPDREEIEKKLNPDREEGK